MNKFKKNYSNSLQNTQNNSVSVEQHRLKCSIGANVNLNASNPIAGDTSKNSTMLLNAIDLDRQWLHVSNTVNYNKTNSFIVTGG